MSGQVHKLAGEQALAVDPTETVWLSASAGTGKTQVLSARVLRLLLQDGVSPSDILCLTFTKAGAAEMAVRVNEVLARWVRMSDTQLSKELTHLGAPHGPATREKARTLFASVLDCPGGGLRIDTIHAFAQWLLSAFPQEAGLTPGTKALEDRDRELLSKQVLTELLTSAKAEGDQASIDALSDLSIRLGPDKVLSYLMRCASATDVWFGPGAWQPPFKDRVKQLIGLKAGADAGDAAELCEDSALRNAAERCLQTLNAWDTKTGREAAAALTEWLAKGPSDRAIAVDSLYGTLLNKDGSPKQLANILKRDPEYADHIGIVVGALAAVAELKTLLELADFLEPALTLGRKFALLWDETKKREGVVDFDDQIRHAARLLGKSEMSDWIRFKLDRQFDHVLVDEAQDTNTAQWQIIDALTDEFFVGESARSDRLRTLFVVGDYKQAIFGFQGTSPENFRLARKKVAKRMEQLKQAADSSRGSFSAKPLRDYGLGRSYRTAQPILTFVDQVIERIGPDKFGLTGQRKMHEGEERPGTVTLWPPVASFSDDSERDSDDDSWLPKSDRIIADRIALQIKQWMREGYPLVKGEKDGVARRAGPGDIMVLVRKRRDLAGLIVARLYAAGVPVAGVDRLRLGAPLAVKDLMAALKFAVQPDDDLSLANVLVSPLVGWSQQDLLECAHRPEKQRLWRHLRNSEDPRSEDAVSQLRELLARVDFDTPQALLHWMLVGPWKGRRKLLRRLGQEAADPINELLNAAFAFQSSYTSSVQGFIQWFEAGDGELKREAEGSSDQVRVMTVHGSKGLQAPIVILADATGNPDNSRTDGIDLPDPAAEPDHPRKIPLPSIPKEKRVGRIAEEADRVKATELQEHWRLLYVAMTRAEEALFIGGALGKREQQPSENSWYAQLAPLFANVEPREQHPWGVVRQLGVKTSLSAPKKADTATAKSDLPNWVKQPVEAEPTPPRPLAPSAAGEDTSPDPPTIIGGDPLAARRGTLIHALLERLPETPEKSRLEAGIAWLRRQADEFSEDAVYEMVEQAMRVLSNPEWQAIFGPDALAEVPLAATVGGRVIGGTVDRLLIQNDRVMVVDFKTSKRPPEHDCDIPRQTMRQMAAYICALEAIYPDRPVTAAVLYTHSPALFELSDDALELHKRSLLGGE